jgi:steroid delta-isomerase-like uncharacterized protein
MSTENRNLVLRWFEEVWNQRRSKTVDELLNEESVCYMNQATVRGSEDFRKLMYQPLLNAFPDLHVQVDGIIDNEHEVVVRWSATGTHTGDGLPTPPTMKAVSFSGMSWICVQDGKLKEGWQSSNIADVIGKLSEPTPVG